MVIDRLLVDHDYDSLDTMAFIDLERLKAQLETVRNRIIKLQNERSSLFQLPGELRNRVFLFAMHGELQDRSKQSRHAIMFREPAFFAASRQIKAECSSVWHNDVLIWEEFDALSRQWRRLSLQDVKAICMERSTVGKLTLVTQPTHCDLMRTRRNVEGSCSICPRKGLVRAQSDACLLPQLRWWVW